MTCTHDRELRISAKCDDRFSITYPDGTRRGDYPPNIPGLTDSTGYVRFSVCQDCGVVTSVNLLALSAHAAHDENDEYNYSYDDEYVDDDVEDEYDEEDDE